MPQGVARPDHLPAGPHRELVHALYELYSASGRPSTRAVSAAIRARHDLRDTVSHETVSAMLKGEGLPKWMKLECVVIYLASVAVDQPDRVATVRRFLELWRAASDTTNPSSSQIPIELGTAGQVTHPRVPTPVTQEGPPSSLLETRSSSEVPPRNPFFTGRNRVIETVGELFNDDDTAIVTILGLGGTGKTQLAIEYLHRYRDRYDLVWWTPSEASTRLRASLSGLGTILSLPTSAAMHHPSAQVLAALQSSNLKWLLILDNAVSPDDLPEIQPSRSGHILVTSRDPGWTDRGPAIELDVFERAESVDLFIKRGVNASREQIDELVGRLGDLPLAVDRAATWSAASDISVEDLLAGVKTNGPQLEFLTSNEATSEPSVLNSFLNYALTDLAAAAPVALELFELFAFLGSEPISLTLLHAGRNENLTPLLQSALRQETALNEAVRELRRHGLVRIARPEPAAIETHRLFQEHLRRWLSAERRARARANIHSIFAKVNPGTPDDIRSWAHYAEVGAHVDSAELFQAPDLEVRRVVLDQVRYLYRVGHYKESLHLGQRLVAAQTDPQEDADLQQDFAILAKHHVANAMRMLGRYAEAKVITLDGLEQVGRLGLSPDHEYRTILGMNKAFDLRLAGQYSEALEVDQEIFELLDAQREPVNPDRLLYVRNNIGVDYRLLGKFRLAHESDQKLVAMWETRGKHDPRTLFARTNLARDLYGLGLFHEALDVISSALRPYRQMVGDHHHQILLGVRTEAICRSQLGDTEAAVILLQQNYEALRDWFSEGHEYALAAGVSLVNALRYTPRRADAMRRATEVTQRCAEQFGENHPFTAAATVSAAAVRRASGEYRRARRSDENAVSILEAALGRDHQFTLAATHNLAVDVELTGERRSALRMSLEVLQRARVAGYSDHPDFVATAMNTSILRMRTNDKTMTPAQLEGQIRTYQSLVRLDHQRVLAARRHELLELDIELPPS